MAYSQVGSWEVAWCLTSSRFTAVRDKIETVFGQNLGPSVESPLTPHPLHKMVALHLGAVMRQRILMTTAGVTSLLRQSFDDRFG